MLGTSLLQVNLSTETRWSLKPGLQGRTVLCFAGVSHSLASKSGTSPAYPARAGDALDHSNFFRCSARHRR
jgi:hypothetical protein